MIVVTQIGTAWPGREIPHLSLPNGLSRESDYISILRAHWWNYPTTDHVEDEPVQWDNGNLCQVQAIMTKAMWVDAWCEEVCGPI